MVVVATGAEEAEPTTYAYGESDQVITQLELSRRIKCGDVSIPKNGTIVMIQCVEQRNDDKPYCSRVCCTTAVKNALILADEYPAARIVVLYRDIRTYGFRETAYREAREKGVLFIRYEPAAPPKLVSSTPTSNAAGSSSTTAPSASTSPTSSRRSSTPTTGPPP